ncbi:hypothetical protein CLV63_102273 [Murinocardiopsis flavida]|uniref:Secreted protein n=1 Tax=Murinocardiopsis flavida TaxID=645275 RepID=A0A2P8DSE9_9ACTN|nr:hypothetical protein [Murinocardiopsis flavida]PSL00146.1 hypothetical protein CLV63_102273 [Murinocardiopsis flavida]
MKRIITRAAAVAALTAAAAGMLAAPAHAEGDGKVGTLGWDSQGDSEAADNDKGGRNVWALVRDDSHPDGSPPVRADFYARGEQLHLQDNHADGHKVVAHLTVAGEGTATFVGGGWRNLSFAEGKAVSLRVCLGNTGVCSNKYGGGRT